MEAEQDHIVTAYDEELDQLSNMISRMSGQVEAQFSAALKAVETRNDDLAEQVRNSDKDIDRLDHEIDELAVRTIALRQPMANDLRSIVSSMKTASDIERIGDYAKNIAKRTVVLNQVPQLPVTRSVVRMGETVTSMMKDIFDAYLQGDSQKAMEVWESDEEVDNHYTSLFRELLTYMMEDPRHISPCTHLLFIAKNIERMGDLCTNIAETLYYRETGERLTDRRPKGESPNDMLVSPQD